MILQQLQSTEKTFIIAKIWANHNRSLSLAKEMIDIATDAGADAAMFQIYSAPTLNTGVDGQ